MTGWTWLIQPHTLLTDIQESLLHLRSSLESWSDTPGLDAQTLLAHLLGRPRAWLLSHPEASLTGDQDRAVAEAIHRIENGEPLPYVIGRWEFFGLEFALSPKVLIPRPETELLVETALAWLTSQNGRHSDRRRAADVGTGSGCIAVSLAVNISDLDVLATDISRDALLIASQNARKHAVAARVRFLQADLLQPVHRKFDLICANLPYIPTAALKQLVVSRQEPSQALDGGPLGLSEISRLVQGAPAWLSPGGLLLAEIEASQGPAACRLASDQFPQAGIEVLPDLAGSDRLLKVQIPD